MTKEELLAEVDAAAAKLVEACRDSGVVAAFVRDLDEANEFRLICPQHLAVRVLFEQAANHLRKNEEAHRC